jgi:hypothetical protein
MPRFRVTSPDGDTITVDGEGPPTDEELDDIFAEHSLSKSGGLKFGQQQMAGFMQPPSTGFAGRSDPKALATELEKPPQQPRAKVPDATSSFGDILDWRERAVSERGGPEPQSFDETEAAGQGAMTGLALAGGARAAVKAAPQLWGATKFAVKDIVVPAAIAHGLETFTGAPKWLAEAVGGYGLAKGLRSIPGALAKRKLKQKTAEMATAKAMSRAEAAAAKDAIKVENQWLKAQEKTARGRASGGRPPTGDSSEFTAEALLRNGTVSSMDAAKDLAAAIAKQAGQGTAKKGVDFAKDVASARTTAAVTKALPLKVKGGNFGEASMEQVKTKVLSWKHKQKFSDDVIVDTMREQFGIPNSQGKQLLQMILAE